MSTSTATAGPTPRLDTTPAGFSTAAVRAIVWREWLVFRRVWLSTAFGSAVEPVIYFLAFGFGFGALVAEVAGLSYREFIATGTIAVGILFSSMFPALINGYFRRKEQQLYDSLLSAPLNVAELVVGEGIWNALRVTGVALVTLAVALAFDVRPDPWFPPALPLVSLTAGFGFSCAGAAFAAKLRSTHSFDFVIVGVVVPMFVVAGTFFPLEGLPEAFRAFGVVNPVTHVVELLRWLAFGTGTAAAALGHALAIVAFDLVALVVGVRMLRGALVD
jgi:lipooligosaccharide transport system permease protein